jgi:hypothetical protein
VFVFIVVTAFEIALILWNVAWNVFKPHSNAIHSSIFVRFRERSVAAQRTGCS